jgi:hypothetical protein
MEKNNRNVFLDVELKNPAQPIPEEEVVEIPPEEPKPEPEEEKIFKKNDLVLQKPVEEKKKDRKTNQKRAVTPKMAAHLERIRKLAQESKAKKKAEKEAKANPQPRAPTPIPPEPQVPQKPQAPVASVGGSIDYDRIINGLWTKQQQHNQMQSQLQLAREQIRKEERAKALKESTSLFTQAYQQHQQKQKQNMGLQALRGFTPQHNHPVFKSRQQPTQSGQSSNPFDVCFK